MTSIGKSREELVEETREMLEEEFSEGMVDKEITRQGFKELSIHFSKIAEEHKVFPEKIDVPIRDESGKKIGTAVAKIRIELPE